MRPRTNPAKSVARHPLLDRAADVGGTAMPFAGCTGAVDEPATGPGLNSVPIRNERGLGDTLRSTGVPTQLK
jgi:hypothetical protein